MITLAKLFIFLMIANSSFILANPVYPESSEEIVLSGFNLTIEKIVEHAKNKHVVRVDPAAWERVKDSHKLLLQAAKEDMPVYGLNRGVGLNKDKTLFEGNILSADAK